MKLACIAMAIGIAVSVPSMASAQTQTNQGLDVSFGIGGGMSIPLLEARDVLKSGFNGQGFLKLVFGRVPIALRAGLNYQNYDLARPLEIASVTRGGSHTLVGGLADVQVLLPGRHVRPYLLACGGAYSMKTELEGDDGPSSSDTRLSAGGGAGFEVVFEGLRIYLEGRVDHVFTNADDRVGSDGLELAPVSLGFVF